MSKKSYLLITTIFFALVGLLHGGRVLLGVSAVIGNWEVPQLLSMVAVLVAVYLAYQGFKLYNK